MNICLTLCFILCAATPVGAALGYILGGILGKYLSWRIAFLLCGIPGLGLAVLTVTIREPKRGTFDAVVDPKTVPSWLQTLKIFANTPLYIFTTIGYIFQTFAIG
jgi:MFS family permease